MKKMFLSISLCLFTAFAFAQMEYKGQKFGAEVKPGEVKPAAKIEAAMCDKKAVYMK